jgi:peptide/nickel transport system substrate-binding protein
MKLTRRTLFAGTSAAIIIPRTLQAQTPARTLVVARNIDDVVSLDPAQAYEFTSGEIVANCYDRLVQYDPADPSRIIPGLAESWRVSDDGRSFMFALRAGAAFASGNPVRPEDVVFSFHRVIRLNKAPAFILAQLGWTAGNVAQLIRKTGEREVTLTIGENFAPSFVINALAARPGSIVDEVETMRNERDGDLGNAWLTQNSAGSGPFRLLRYRRSESATLEANARHWRGSPGLAQVILRHTPEPGTQRLQLERGDIDVARDLGPEQIEALSGRQGLRIERRPQATVHFFSLNQKHENLRNPALWEAMRYLVDYENIAGRLLRGQMRVHQAFLPVGLPGALTDTPFRLDVERARAILARAGLQNGIASDMDVISGYPFTEMAQAIQATMAQANIRLNLVMQTAGQLITKYRARNHQMTLVFWNPDFWDPHSNAKGFAYNVDNSDSAVQSTGTWRNHWLIPELSERTRAALTERDPARRTAMYGDLQREVQRSSPFIFTFQAQATIAMRDAVQNYVHGPINDLIQYRAVTKA